MLLGPKSMVYGGVDKFKVAKIVRIALRKHEHPVSRMKVLSHDELEVIGGTGKYRYFLPLTPGIKEVAVKMNKLTRNAPRAKRTLCLESIQEVAV